MASQRLRATPLTGRSSHVVSVETIWKRLREAGFGEESVPRRDKAALIADITKLETEEKTRGNGKLVGDADNVNGVNSSLLGRKRPSNILSQEHADMLEQPTWKLRKKMRQTESDAIEETTNKGASSIQVPLATDDRHPESLIQNSEWTEPPNGCVNEENELSKVSSSQLILSQSKAHENGIAHGSEDLPHAGIGGLSSVSYINGIVKKVKIEKALHDMRTESAEKKVAYESKLAEAHILMENAQKKFDEAENKLLEAETKHVEATRSLNIASRSLQDVEAREDDLRRRQMSFKSEYDAKEKEINLQKQNLLDGQIILHDVLEKVTQGQSLLNQRGEYITERTKELKNFEKELEEAKANLDEERRALKEEKTNLDLDEAALSAREEAVVKRESLLGKKEREILILQENVANKEYDEIQRLADENQISLERKRNEFEAELERRRISFEEEMEIKCSDFKIRESELNRRENIIQEREKSLELSLVEISEKQEDVIRRLKWFEEREQILHSAQETRESEILKMLEEREEIQKMREDLEKIKIALEDKKEEISLAQKQLELTESERNELVVLETKLKEEIDSLRAQKMELVAEADKLRAEKEKFEIEWELIDEKKEELRKETERVTEERKIVSSLLKNEHDSIKLEKENLQIQLKNDVEALIREEEEFVSKMERGHSEWFSKIQQERDDFVEDINLQRKELENCIDKRWEEIERYLKQKEEAFEQEKVRELEHINSHKEMIVKELEHVAVELKRLENERAEISLDRGQREREWSEIKKSIEELSSQLEKLQNQRELLHADRYEINQQIQQLKRLEELNIESENRALSEIKSNDVKSDGSKALRKCSNVETLTKNLDPNETMSTPEASCRHIQQAEKTSIGASPPASSPLSWLRKCTKGIFKRSPEKVCDSEPNVTSQFSTIFGQVSARKEIKSLNSNLLDKEKTRGNGKLVGDADNVNGVNSSLLGRKRPSNILWQEHADMLEQPTWKLRKKMRQIESDAIEETTNKGASSIQVPLPTDDRHPALIQNRMHIRARWCRQVRNR